MSDLRETCLQFGSGKFLRAFADLFIHQANAAGHHVGRVVVVQSTGGERAKALNQQAGRYHVLVRGLENEQVVESILASTSISRALVAAPDWHEVLAVARSADLRFIISNTAEEGYRLNPADRISDDPPRSFPARLLQLLKHRFEARQAGVTVLPCELFESNAELLLDLLLQLGRTWHLPSSFETWLQTKCMWRNTLVDRIVTHPPANHPLAASDALLTVAEPFAFWGIEVKEGGGGGIFPHPAMTPTTDVKPFFLRKVRILNAAHTALVPRALARGIATVREALLDREIVAWLEQLLFEEIIPTLDGRVDEPEEFARRTLERFRNPFLEHKIRDIALYHEAKVKIRLATTCEEYITRFGRRPRLLDEAIAGTPAR
jgi:tagaturonate reductase